MGTPLFGVSVGDGRPQRAHRSTPVALTVLGMLAMLGSVRLGVGSLTQPGPGAWPLVVAAAIVLSGGWLTVSGVDSSEEFELGDVAKVAAAAGTLALFVVLLPLIGMPVPAFVLLVTWLRLFGESWRLTLLTSLIAVIALQIVFVEVLAVPLPVGPLAPGR